MCPPGVNPQAVIQKFYLLGYSARANNIAAGDLNVFEVFLSPSDMTVLV